MLKNLFRWVWGSGMRELLGSLAKAFWLGDCGYFVNSVILKFVASDNR
ncbi:hypothetical protein H6F73_18225 [Microcoleus sp. FACHB-68]|nr:hypothetical protein [Microcoleus sp. FACHB-68]